VFSKAALVPVLGGATDPDMASLWRDEEIEEAKRAMAAIPSAMQTSAAEGWGVDELKESLIALLREHKQTLPSSDNDFVEKSDEDKDKPAYIQML
jgi:selenocysteine-specific translation elongation factor